ncbi:MAG: L-threonylcarbamoyladenylate synthase [Phycisphaerales bacterium]
MPYPSPGDQADDAMISRAADTLRAGRVVAFPTETVYGLGASALDESAVSLVFALKGRPASNPLIVHVHDTHMARGVCRSWPESAARLAERFWPGPLTLVLPRAAIVPDLVTSGGDTVAIRIPDHPTALKLIARFGAPIVGPSANRSGMVSPTTAEHVRQAFGRDDRVMILDGGPCRRGIESTVVWLADASPRILRPGFVQAHAISEALDQPLAELGPAAPDQPEGAAHASPGLLARHYAPNARAILINPGTDPAPHIHPGIPAERVALLASPPLVDAFQRSLGSRLIHTETMPADASAYAHALYAALRRADDAAPDLILIERPARTDGIWAAIHDRLKRATSAE